MKKRLLALLLCLCMLTGTMYLPVSAEGEADYTDPETGLVYEILTEPVGDANGTVKLRAVSPTWAEPVTEILAILTIEGADYDVTEVATAAFVGQTGITEVNLPKCVRVGAYAFEGCTGITRVNLPSAEQIGMAAFSGCTEIEAISSLPVLKVEEKTFLECSSLTAIDLPEVKTIGVEAFSKCSALASVTAPKATEILKNAFAACQSLTVADFPKAEAVWEFAFNGCTSLLTANLPKAKTIAERAFDNCPALETVDLSSAVTLGDRVFNACVSLTELDLPKAESLGSFALNRCESLISLSMPNVETIGARALGGCDALTEITFGAVAPTLANGALGTTSTDRTILVPEGAVGYDVAPFTECTVTEMILPGAEIYFYTDAEYNEELPADTILPVGTTVYYEILCEEGVFCPSVWVDGTVASGLSFTVAREVPIGELLTARFVLGGDLDESGTLDNRDVTALLRYLAKWNVSPELDAADYNRDQGIDNRDVTMMLRYLAGWYDRPVTDAPATVHTVYTETAVFAPLAEAENEPWEVVTLTDANALTSTVLAGLTEEDAALATETFERRLMRTATVAVVDIAAGSRAEAFAEILSIPADVAEGLANGTAYRAIVALKDADEAEVLADTALRASLPETTVFYSDFGAAGDGVTDDFLALQAAHAYANANGYPVRTNPGATYYIGTDSYYKTIEIQTDTDFTDASFIIDDTGITAESNSSARGTPPFTVTSSLTPIDLSDRVTTLAKGTTALDFRLERDALVYVEDTTKKIFIRSGGNANSGDSLRDSFILHTDGTIDENAPIIWDFDNITSIRAYLLDDPITLRGGEFTTIANHAEMKYNYFWRGITVRRSNVTLDGMKHYVTGETKETGSPYMGFIYTEGCANVTIQNVLLTGHYLYQPIGEHGAPIQLGTYDMVFNRTVNVSVLNSTQTTDILDTNYWGIMQSTYSKNVLLDGCTFSRFDAHQGVTNATLRNCVFGHHGVFAVGAEQLTIEETVFNAPNVIRLREDYGSTWEGDVLIRDCMWKAGFCILYGYNYGDHYYGYDCVMPTNVTIDGFYVMDRGLQYEGIYLFSNFNPNNTSEDDTFPYPLKPTERITVKNFRSDTGYHWNPSMNEIFFRDTEIVDLDA